MGVRTADRPSGDVPPSVPPELAGHPDYEVLRELGKGGMGIVYLARDRLMQRQAVLKVMNRALLDRPGAEERFLREIRSAARLSHPNVVTAYSAQQLGGLLVFAMEYVEGEDLARVVKARGPLPVVNACYYAQQAALGLQHAFEKGMVHRDIKPQNLILAREGKKHVVKILDFGLAKATREQGEDNELTGPDKMLGTPDYIAPEQMRDAARADIRADVYSLGCTLYYLLSGAPPFKATSLFGILQAHQTEEARPLNLTRPDVPPELAAVVAKMMAKDPAERHQKPVEVAHALAPFIKPGAKAAVPALPSGATAPARQETLLEQEPARARQETLLETSATASDAPVARAARPKDRPSSDRPAARKRWPLLAGAAAGLLLLGLVGLWAAGVFRVKTKEGVLEITVSEPGADVYVDGEKVTVTWGDGGKKAEITARPGAKVEVRKDGFTVEGGEVTVKEGERQVLTATLKPLAAGGPGAPAQDFVPLFNGKDLKGWRTAPKQPGNWRVEHGVLIGSGREFVSYLYTDEEYRDFHLRVEARINDGGNSGVCFRAPFGATIPPEDPKYLAGYEAQINSQSRDPNKTGSLLAVTSRGALVSVRESPVPPGEWFTMEVIVEDYHVVIKVNGKTTADYQDEKRLFTSGFIGLQQLNPSTVVEFRKIEIQDLSPRPSASLSRFPARVPPPDRGKWLVLGDALVQKSLDPSVVITFGDRTWTDYDFSVDLLRGRGEDQAALMFRVQDPRNFALFGLGSFKNTSHSAEWWADGKEYPPRPLRIKGRLAERVWYTARVRVRGDRVQCYLNEELQLDFRMGDNPAGCVGLRTWEAAYRFRNIKVTAPDGKVLLEGLPDL
jgi:serine/threonine protein kinase